MSGPPVAHHLKVGRTARYFTQGEIEGAAEVWFVLHGYSMLATSFLQWFGPAAVPGRLLVAPEGLSRSYYEEKGGRRVGASWMTKEDREAEIEDYLQYLDRLAERIRLSVSGEPRIEVHGFSQGAATACRWIAFGGMRPDRLVVWGSLLPPDLPLDRFGERLTRAGLTMCLGSRDKYISAGDFDQELARLAAAGLHPEVHRFDGGHRVDPTVLRSLTAQESSS
jgi:predicted esterase